MHFLHIAKKGSCRKICDSSINRILNLSGNPELFIRTNNRKNIIMENQGEIILYQPDEEIKLDVHLENETVWLSIDEMSHLFGRDISVVGKHIRNIFKEGELIKDSVWEKFAYTASDNKTYQVDYYNLDVIISVGYRVKSQRGTQFRQWLTRS